MCAVCFPAPAPLRDAGPCKFKDFYFLHISFPFPAPRSPTTCRPISSARLRADAIDGLGLIGKQCGQVRCVIIWMVHCSNAIHSNSRGCHNFTEHDEDKELVFDVSRQL